MISIIICARTKHIKAELSNNISNTIGCAYELIIINNSENKYSIFEAYNLGIEKSKGDLLAFIHDDILIHTNNWGEKLENIFSADSKIGLLGIAGAKYKSKAPSSWSSCPNKYRVINLIQHNPDGTKKVWNTGFEKNKNEEVVVIDGVFMIARKTNKIKFQSSIEGFHGYDLNLCLEFKKLGYKNIVSNEILIEHFSQGNVNKSWFQSMIKMHKLFENDLPLIVNNITVNKEIQKIEEDNDFSFISRLFNIGLRKEARELWFRLFISKPFSKKHILMLKSFLQK